MENLLSIIVPAYNEASNLKVLVPEWIKFCTENNYNLIIVNDGSVDSTREVLQDFKCKKLEMIHHKVNKGYGAALKTGIEHADTEFIITMDADGQNNPQDIPALLEKLNTGFDVVSGWRKNRKDKYLSRILPSQIANFIISIVCITESNVNLSMSPLK